MSRKKIAVIIAGVIAVVLLAGGLWAVVAHNNRAKALEEATAAYTKAGAVLEKVVSGVDAAGCIENGGSKDICAALEKTIADARVGLVEKPGKDADKMKEGAKTLEKLTENLQALGITLATQQAKAAQDYLDKECPLHLDPECDSLRKGDLKLPEIKLKTEAIKARVAGAAPAQAPAADGSSHGTGGGNADYSGESDSGSSYSEAA